MLKVVMVRKTESPKAKAFTYRVMAFGLSARRCTSGLSVFRTCIYFP
jgi:hypothetical protein